jgi:hypothetical protein
MALKRAGFAVARRRNFDADTAHIEDLEISPTTRRQLFVSSAPKPARDEGRRKDWGPCFYRSRYISVQGRLVSDAVRHLPRN